ncbi:hypothetical protein HID58_049778, partial [Brassica napus]
FLLLCNKMQSMEESAELLRMRCLRFYKGCRKYTEGLGEGYDSDIGFANALESLEAAIMISMCCFWRNRDIQGSSSSQNTTKPNAVFKGDGLQVSMYLVELISLNVGFFLGGRTMLMTEARKRFDKLPLYTISLFGTLHLILCASEWTQARENYLLSLRKSTRLDVAATIEEREAFQDLHSARTTFRASPVSSVSALSNAEAKKRFEFLEAVRGQWTLISVSSRDGMRHTQETHKGYRGCHAICCKRKISDNKKGYLSKRSSNLRATGKEDSSSLIAVGCYTNYRKPWNWSSMEAGLLCSQEHDFREQSRAAKSMAVSSHYHGGVHEEKPVARHTVNLLTSDH